MNIFLFIRVKIKSISSQTEYKHLVMWGFGHQVAAESSPGPPLNVQTGRWVYNDHTKSSPPASH